MSAAIRGKRAETEDARDRLLTAVIAIWTHTEMHTTYVPGLGYRWQSGEPPCGDPALHARLAAEEGEAWHEYARAVRS